MAQISNIVSTQSAISHSLRRTVLNRCVHAIIFHKNEMSILWHVFKKRAINQLMPRTGTIVGDPEDIPDTFIRHAWVGDLVQVFLMGERCNGLAWGIATDEPIWEAQYQTTRTRFMIRLVDKHFDDDSTCFPFARAGVVYRNLTDEVIRANAAGVIQKNLRDKASRRRTVSRMATIRKELMQAACHPDRFFTNCITEGELSR